MQPMPQIIPCLISGDRSEFWCKGFWISEALVLTALVTVPSLFQEILDFIMLGAVWLQEALGLTQEVLGLHYLES